MSESTVLYEERGAVALVTLNRPQALNSLNHEMHSTLWAQLDKAEANKAIRAMVITGAGRGFCAGADLSEFDFSDGPDRIRVVHNIGFGAKEEPLWMFKLHRAVAHYRWRA
mgnify:CR=1 FL=1